MHVVMLGVQADAARALLARGHEVTVLHERTESDIVGELPDGVGRLLPVATYGDVSGMLGGLRRSGSGPVDAVATMKEFAVVPAAVLGTSLGARCLDPDVALRCRDKARQKAAWRAAGVPTADWLVVAPGDHDPDVLAAEIAGHGLVGDLVVKPVASAGTRSVARVTGPKEAAAFVLETARGDRARGRMVVERFNEGDEWHVDGLVRGGELRSLLVSRYLAPLVETKNGHPTATVAFEPARHEGLYAEASEVTSRAVRALGLADGVFHFEMFGGPGRFVAGELAARPGGGWITSLVRRMLGFDPLAATYLSVTGDHVDFSAPTPGVFGYTHVPPVAGRTNRLRAEDLAGIPGVFEVRLGTRVGEAMPDMRRGSYVKLGTVMARGTDRAECETTLREVIRVARAVNGG